ncbi:Uncharacterised protein [Aeromonas salmonicida]|nr:Uncharacterised protein [Aeromonas salmonicida]
MIKSLTSSGIYLHFFKMKTNVQEKRHLVDKAHAIASRMEGDNPVTSCSLRGKLACNNAVSGLGRVKVLIPFIRRASRITPSASWTSTTRVRGRQREAVRPILTTPFRLSSCNIRLKDFNWKNPKTICKIHAVNATKIKAFTVSISYLTDENKVKRQCLMHCRNIW